MVIDSKMFKCTGTKKTSEEVLSSGEYFSGSIYTCSTSNSWIAFNLVNKEKMEYILSEIDFNEEVKFEIQTYAQYPKSLQQPSDWEEFNKGRS
tara:strand:+ start:274 stop:552 length:279 start_codon:yes stop_codon:yes gene_type:complete